MSEILNYNEIEKRFDSEWVLIGDPQTGEGLSIRSGTVLWHSKNRDEVYKKARELKLLHSAILFLGQVPTDVAVVL